jgi:hypothetical protein
LRSAAVRRRPPGGRSRLTCEVIKRRQAVEILMTTGAPRAELKAALDMQATDGRLPRKYPMRTIQHDIAIISRRWGDLALADVEETRRREVGRLTRILARLESEEKIAAMAPLLKLLYDITGAAAPKRLELGGQVGVTAQAAVAVATEDQAREVIARIEARLAARAAGVEGGSDR